MMKSYFNVLQDEDDDYIDEETAVDESSIEQQQKLKEFKEKEKEQLVDEQPQPVATPSTNGMEIVGNKRYTMDIQFDFTETYSEEDMQREFDQPWVLYFDKKKKEKHAAANTTANGEEQYLQNIKKIGTFSSLNALKELWNGLTSPVDSNISIFKEGIEPAWEDVKNKDGGKYSVNYMKDNSEYTKVISSWFTLLTTIVYATQWENYNQTNGIVLSFRNWGVSINLWNENSENQDSVQSLKDALQNLLKVKYAKFSSHNNTILLKTLKKNDEKKKKTHKLFGKIDHNSNFQQSFVASSSSGASGFESDTNGFGSTNYSGHNVFSRAYNNTNGGSSSNGTGFDKMWSVPNPLRKIKPLQSTSTQQDDLRLRREQQIREQQQQQQQQQVVVQPVAVVPSPEIPTGVNAWSTGILLGKDVPLSSSSSSLNVQQQQQNEQTVPEQLQQQSPQQQQEVKEDIVVVQQQQQQLVNNSNAWNVTAQDWQREIEEGEIVEDQQPVSVVPEKPRVNAWSTGVLLTQAVKVEDPKTKVIVHTIPIVPSPTPVLVKEVELEEGEIVEDEVVPKKEDLKKKVETKKDEKKDEKKQVKKEKKEDKKEEKKEDKKDKKEERFWDDNLDPKLPSKPKVVEPPTKGRRTYQKPQPVSLWEKGDVLKLMSETVPSDTPVTQDNTTVVANSSSTTSTQQERIVIAIKPKEEKKIVIEPINVRSSDEWIEADKPKKVKAPKVVEEEGEKKEKDSTTTTAPAVEKKAKKVEKPVPVIVNKPNSKESVLRALEIEDPIEYPTPKKENSSSSNNNVKPTKTSTTNNNNIKKTSTSTSTTTSNNAKSTTTVAKKSHQQVKSTSSSSSSSSSLSNQLLSKSLMMNLTAVFIVILLGFLLKYLFN